MKVLIVLAMMLLYCTAAPLLDHIRAGGFEISRIHSPHPLEKGCVSEVPTILWKKIANMPFSYLGKGAQCYAFLSDDGTTVLKFFKQQHLYLPSWLENLPLQRVQASAKRKQQRREALFESHRIAWQKVPEVAGLLTLHLGETKNLWGNITLLDPAGRKSIVNLDKLQFVLQRYAKRLDLAVEDRLSEGNAEAAAQLFTDAKKIILRRLEAGVIDEDPAFLQNYGATSEGRVIHFDVGTFAYRESFDLEERLAKETVSLRNSFKGLSNL